MQSFQNPGQNPNQTNPNVVANPQTGQLPRVKGPEMNERDYANDLLATEKYLMDNIALFTREASNETLSSSVFQILQETHSAQRNIFNLMFKKDWYKLTEAQPQEIQQTIQQFSNYEAQFPY